MIFAIMAAVGILLICLGIEEIGSLLLLPGIITIVVNVIIRVNEKRKFKLYWKEREAKRHREELAEEKRKQEAVDRQNGLINRFKNSPLTKDVINVICGGNPNQLPSEIVIRDTQIQGKRGGSIHTFDFAAHRIHAFEQVICYVDNEKEELKYVVRPQIAMAEALNSLLGDNYAIRDYPMRELLHEVSSYDEQSYIRIRYTSDYVTMVLKSTLPNKNF